jgi:hypothetical protein
LGESRLAKASGSNTEVTENYRTEVQKNSIFDIHSRRYRKGETDVEILIVADNLAENARSATKRVELFRRKQTDAIM